MNIKRLVLLSLGVYGLSMPLMVQAADPVIPMTQQEQLQQDRDTQRERNLRLDAERVGTVVSEPALIDVPSDKNDLHPFSWTDIIKLLFGNEFGILPDSFLLI